MSDSSRDRLIERATEAMSLPGEKGLVRQLTHDDATLAVDALLVPEARDDLLTLLDADVQAMAKIAEARYAAAEARCAELLAVRGCDGTAVAFSGKQRSYP